MWEMAASLISGIAEWICWFASAFKVVFWSGAMPGFWFYLLLVVIFAVWLGSGFLAATLAELCGKSPGEAFMMGVLAPWIYPYTKAREWEIQPTEEEVAAAEAAAIREQYEEDEDDDEDEEIDGYCKRWFSDIPVDDDGERPGPFRMTLLDGNVLEISVIRDLRDDLMVAVNAQTGKTLRIKYDNIADFESYS